jgi:hypothetical protein
MQLQGAAAGSAAAGDALWLQNANAASAALMAANRPQNLLLANQAGGGPGLASLAVSSGMLSPGLQQPPSAGLAGNPQTSALVATYTQLLEQYQVISWNGLAAAQANSNVREQLLTEVVLQLTLLHTLSGVLKSTLGPGDALSDFSYLGGAARRHIATFSRLSQAGDLAVQLLAMVTPLACRHLTSTGGCGCAVHVLVVCSCIAAAWAALVLPLLGFLVNREHRTVCSQSRSRAVARVEPIG